jgi:hypothetical protein
MSKSKPCDYKHVFNGVLTPTIIIVGNYNFALKYAFTASEDSGTEKRTIQCFKEKFTDLLKIIYIKF